jgi:hypothetical protein
MYLVDWIFELSRLQRVILWAIAAGALVWAYRKYALPWLGQQETELDVALLVERKQGIDSDLVAALQFESEAAPDWGSVQLEEAVIHYVADFGKGWNLLEGFDRREMSRRVTLSLVSVALLGIAAAIYWPHANVFFRRMLMSSAHYPTRTVIEQVVINAQPVTLLPVDQLSTKCPYGQPLRFEIACSGELPQGGKVDLVTPGGLETTVELKRVEQKSTERNAVYAGQLPRMLDTLECQLYLGDAWTDPARLGVLPLPVVEAILSDTPPNYASGVEQEEKPEGNSRQISVVEGSRVDLKVLCKNKSLTKATLVIGDDSFPLKKTDKQGRDWSLVVDKTPLAKIQEPLSYTIAVEDEDGMQPQRPVAGFIRIKADRPPQIHADVVTRFVLPAAQPQISYRAMDDFGIAGMKLLLEVEREADGAMEEHTLEVRQTGDPVLREALPLRESYPLDLTPFGLAKGDQVRVVMEATDFRGGRTGRSAVSDTLLLTVTDESGILSALSESDERSARQLDAIIRRQLGIGETP